MTWAVFIAAALPPGEQRNLLEARQMQALSFAVHIPLVCFAVALPAFLLFVEWLYAYGDELYRTLARRWTRIMVALFAAGVVTGTILSFEMGLLWPNVTGTFGGVFGLGFAIEGFSFFMEAIFIGIYVYGWSRLSPRAHFASGIPIALAGFTGSLMVIAVNGWMNQPTDNRAVATPSASASTVSSQIVVAGATCSALATLGSATPAAVTPKTDGPINAPSRITVASAPSSGERTAPRT